MLLSKWKNSEISSLFICIPLMLCLEKRRYLPFFKSDNNSVQHFLLASHNTSSFLCKPSKTETYAHVSNKDRLRVIHISDDEECEQRSILTLRNTPTPQFPPNFLVLMWKRNFPDFFEDESGRSSSLITEIKVQNTAKHCTYLETFADHSIVACNHYVWKSDIKSHFWSISNIVALWYFFEK